MATEFKQVGDEFFLWKSEVDRDGDMVPMTQADLQTRKTMLTAEANTITQIRDFPANKLQMAFRIMTMAQKGGGQSTFKNLCDKLVAERTDEIAAIDAALGT